MLGIVRFAPLVSLESRLLMDPVGLGSFLHPMKAFHGFVCLVIKYPVGIKGERFYTIFGIFIDARCSKPGVATQNDGRHHGLGRDISRVA